MPSPAHVTKTTFDTEVLQATQPVLVDFYADWCGPCRMLASTLERLAAEFGSRAKIVKVNVDAEPELAGRFRVQSIPTLAFFVDGKLVAQRCGLIPEPALRQALTQVVEAKSTTARRVG